MIVVLLKAYDYHYLKSHWFRECSQEVGGNGGIGFVIYLGMTTDVSKPWLNLLLMSSHFNPLRSLLDI